MLYAILPLQILAAALAIWLMRVKRADTITRRDRTLACIPVTSAALLAGIAWADTAPLSSSVPVVFLLALPLLALLGGLLLSLPMGLVLAVTRIVQRQGKASALLLVSCAVAVLVAALAGAATDADAPVKRTLREYVVGEMIEHPDLSSAAHNGSWNTMLPVGWQWLSSSGEVSWHSSGEHSQVTFCDSNGILSGYGYTYCLDGSAPTGEFAGYTDETPAAPHWYMWIDP